MTGRRAKRTEIWDSEIVAVNMWCTFDLVGFKVIWGHAIVLKWHVTRLIVERNGRKFGTRGYW